MDAQDADVTMAVTSFDPLWGFEVRWHNLGDLHFGPRGLARRSLIYAAVLWALIAIAAPQLPLAGMAVAWLSWWMKPLAACALAWALSMLDVEGLRAHELLAPLALHLLGAKHFDGFRPCPPVGGRWRPRRLIMLPDGSGRDFAAITYRGPGTVTCLREATLTRDRDRWPTRRRAWTAKQTSAQPARLRIVVPAGRAVRLRARRGGS